MHSALGSPSKKKKGLLSKQKKLPSNGVRPVVYPDLEGGNPFEPGTKNYQKALEMRRRLHEVSSKGPCAFYVSAYDPFSPDHYHGASYFRAPVPDKKLFPGPISDESEAASPPSKDD